MPTYHRLAHLKDQPLVKAGDWVKRGQQIGVCGTSGASTGPHLHYDIFNTKKYGWFFYVYGWSLAFVKSIFKDPTPYIKNGIPMRNSRPHAGYAFLQYVRSRSGSYYHPGIDCNDLNDYGKPVYAPVEGRVVYVSTLLGKVWRSTFGWLNWNHGWGNMVIIEEMPDYGINFHE